MQCKYRWYLGFGGIQALVSLVYNMAFTFMVACASRYIHIQMLGNALVVLSFSTFSEFHEYLKVIVLSTVVLEIFYLILVQGVP